MTAVVLLWLRITVRAFGGGEGGLLAVALGLLGSVWVWLVVGARRGVDPYGFCS